MGVEMVPDLSGKDWEGVKALVEACNAADGTAYDGGLDGDFYYLVRKRQRMADENAGSGSGTYAGRNASAADGSKAGADSCITAVLAAYRLGETVGGQDVLEIAAFTHPAFRQRGLFTRCFRRLLADFRGYGLRFLVKSPGAEAEAGGILQDTRDALSALSAVHARDELFMEKRLAHPTRNPGELLRPYGEVHFTSYSRDTLYLYGLLVYARYQGKGYGRKLLEEAEAYVPEHRPAPEAPCPGDGACGMSGAAGRYRKILLQVSAGNVAACKLYKAMGYRVTERICYYDLPAPACGSIAP